MKKRIGHLGLATGAAQVADYPFSANASQMIVEPELRIPDFAKAGADIISVHAEQSSTIHLHRTLNMVRPPV